MTAADDPAGRPKRNPAETDHLTDRVVAVALERAGLRRTGPIRVLPTGPGRVQRRALRVPVTNAAGQACAVVVKFVAADEPEGAAALEWEHHVARDLYLIAETLRSACLIGHTPLPAAVALEHLVSIPGPHSPGSDTVAGPWLVSIRAYVDAVAQLTPRSWGQLIGLLHLVGATAAAGRLLLARPTNVLVGLDAEHLSRVVASPGHPYRNDPGVLQRVAVALQECVVRALDADPVPLLVHRDLHPLNIAVGAHGPVAFDWAEAGWGNRSDDFAWMHVAVTRFGAPPCVLEEARAGYEDIAPGQCPSREQIRAAGQVRELLCLAFTIQNAHLSPAHRREARVEMPILADPGAVTEGWTALFNPAAFRHPALRKVRSR
jgi:hypothetical protein